MHTIRYLRPIQIHGRLWRHLYRPRPDECLAPPIRPISQPLFPFPARPVSLTGPRRFRFLNREGVLGPRTENSIDHLHVKNRHFVRKPWKKKPPRIAPDWDPPDQDRLWRYNLHYFDDLNASDAIERRDWHLALLQDWVRDNPPCAGTGWEPYPASLRIVNWIKWALTNNTPPDNSLPPVCIHSLAIQARWLSKRLETHLLGNHLLANAKALVFAGLFFEGKEAEHWLATGLRILADQIPEQILADGGHFERSTMYHALVLEDMLDLCNITRSYPGALTRTQHHQVSDWPTLAARMQRWLLIMRHPDGEIAFFNDAATGIAPTPDELAGYADRLELGVCPAYGGRSEKERNCGHFSAKFEDNSELFDENLRGKGANLPLSQPIHPSRTGS
ncbi:MAG: hypothetical protein KJO08_09585 [Gammaproteobacteria bacterium]|nr:hypothetical protein [Gammaproteobacteria bacterium]